MRTSEQSSLQQILSIGLLLILTGMAVFSSACAPKAVPVSVTKEDVIRANQAAQEGDMAFNRKDYYAALIKYLEASRFNPKSDHIFNRLGIIYSQLKFYDEASAAFLRAMQLNPRFPYPVNNLGSVMFAQRNLSRAEKYFKKAISMKGDEASFHMNLGSLYLERKKPAKAMAEWHKGLALEPDIFAKSNAISLIGGGSGSSAKERSYYVARLFASEGKVETALQNLKQAFENGFTDVDEIERQPDFDPIRKDPRFVEFMKNASILIKLRSNVGLPENQQ